MQLYKQFVHIWIQIFDTEYVLSLYNLTVGKVR